MPMNTVALRTGPSFIIWDHVVPTDLGRAHPDEAIFAVLWKSNSDGKAVPITKPRFNLRLHRLHIYHFH
nr:hypothetical protein CFP56_11382 [Quercus suber]